LASGAGLEVLERYVAFTRSVVP